MDLLKSALSFETTAVLLLFAGNVKAIPGFSIPVDLTALFFCLAVVEAAWILARRGFCVRRRTLTLTVLALAFALWVVASLAWTPGSVYANKKAFYTVFLSIGSLILAAVVIAPEHERLQRFCICLTIFSSYMCARALTVLIQGGTTSSIVLEGANYLSLGRIVGMGLICLIALQSPTHLAEEILNTVAIVAHCIVLLSGGGRGPLIALAAALVVYAVTRRDAMRRVTRLLATLAAGTYAAFRLSSMQLPSTLRRMLLLLANDTRSIDWRETSYRQSLEIWVSKPLIGHGIGSWPILTGQGDVRSYTHDIILEVLSELGIVGLVLLLLPLAVAVRYGIRDIRVSKDRLASLTLALLVFTFANAMVSGDLHDNRPLFLCIGLMAGAVQRKETD